MSSRAVRSSIASASSAVITPFSTALARSFAGSRPLPSSLTRISTWLPRCDADSRIDALGGLARGGAHVGQLEAVIDGVADEVHQRLVDRLDEQLVELGVLADQLEARALAEVRREVAHGAHVLAEHAGDRDHAQPHHLLAQLVGDRVEPVGAVIEVAR